MTSQQLPHWDLSNVYPGIDSDEFKEAVDRLKKGLDECDDYLSEQGIEQGGDVPHGRPVAVAKTMSRFLNRTNALRRLYGTLNAYVYSFVATDSYNTKARRIMSELEALEVRLERQERQFQGWIGTVAEKSQLFEAALAAEGPAQQHAFYMREKAEQSRYLMSPAEETLAAELSLSGSRAWGKLQTVVTSQVTVDFERDGVVEELPIAVLQNMRNDADGELRRRAYEAELAAWDRKRETLAACLNGVKGAVSTLNARRGREDSLDRPLDQARIDRETLEAMLSVVEDSLPLFRRYFKRKAERLGKDKLAWWDLFAPVGESDRRYTFVDAKELILDEFGGFSDRLQTLARRAFEAEWIDAEPRDGKQGGAFCMSVPAVEESRILCNFDGSFDQLSTLAHELGHAYHNECRIGKTMLQRPTPMTLAETASILAQTLVTNAVLADAGDPEEELAILESYMIDTTQVVVDIYSRYLFEKAVFERRPEAELSADDFCDMMLEAQRKSYGDGLDPRYLHRYMWAWKPHYYSANRSFYNFPYTFGKLFGLGLYTIYQERGDAFLPAYDDLLSSTGEARSADLAARFGIDIRDRGFWESSMGIIEERIERYLAL